MKEEKYSESYRFEEGLQGTTWVFKIDILIDTFKN